MSTNDSLSLFSLSFFDRTDLVVVMCAYFDASEAGDYFGVGGYVFRKKHIRAFEKGWRAMLRKHGIDHFHMTDCNTGKGPFKGKSDDDCDACAREAIELINNYALEGFSCGVRLSDFNSAVAKDGIIRRPMSLCVMAVLAQCSSSLRKSDPTARIAYVFEAGDVDQADVNQLLQATADSPRRRERYGYEKHAFLPKRQSYPTQAADILAWQVTKHYERQDRQIARLRGDFSHLVDKVPTHQRLFGRESLLQLQEMTTAQAPVDNPDRVAGLYLRMNKDNEKAIQRELLKLIRSG